MVSAWFSSAEAISDHGLKMNRAPLLASRTPTSYEVKGNMEDMQHRCCVEVPQSSDKAGMSLFFFNGFR